MEEVEALISLVELISLLDRAVVGVGLILLVESILHLDQAVVGAACSLLVSQEVVMS